MSKINRLRLPEWIKIRQGNTPQAAEVRSLVKSHGLHTVCEEARCPNLNECWGKKTATFMILGDICTRSCGFCSVTTGKPVGLDQEEPDRVAAAIATLGLRHAVITSVNRDDLADGGAAIFSRTISETRRRNPGCIIEVLIPDFKGDPSAVRQILHASGGPEQEASKVSREVKEIEAPRSAGSPSGPDIFSHNTETVPRLYPTVRPQAKYSRTLDVLAMAKREAPHDAMRVKTGMMLGLGEGLEEVYEVMRDLRAVGVDMLTLGQYLQPTRDHLPVSRFLPPEEFVMLHEKGIRMGFKNVASGPLVRSSYHAEEQAAG